MPFITVDTRQNFIDLLIPFKRQCQLSSTLEYHQREEIKKIIDEHLSTASKSSPSLFFSEIISFSHALAIMEGASKIFHDYHNPIKSPPPCSTMINQILLEYSALNMVAANHNEGIKIYRQALTNFDHHLEKISQGKKCSFTITPEAFTEIRGIELTYAEIVKTYVTQIIIPSPIHTETSALMAHSVVRQTGSINRSPSAAESEEPQRKCCCVIS